MYDVIINKSTIERYCQVSVASDKKDIKRFCRDAQEFDFKQIVCSEFYNDLLTNYTTANYRTLIEGGHYQYEDDRIYFLGLEAVLSHWAYGRFIIESPINSTSHGIVTKKTQHSEPVPLKDRERLAGRYFDKATQLFSDVKLFLDRNEDTYTAWECSSSCEETNSYSNIEVWK